MRKKVDYLGSTVEVIVEIDVSKEQFFVYRRPNTLNEEVRLKATARDYAGKLLRAEMERNHKVSVLINNALFASMTIKANELIDAIDSMVDKAKAHIEAITPGAAENILTSLGYEAS